MNKRFSEANKIVHVLVRRYMLVHEVTTARTPRVVPSTKGMRDYLMPEAGREQETPCTIHSKVHVFFRQGAWPLTKRAAASQKIGACIGSSTQHRKPCAAVKVAHM